MMNEVEVAKWSLIERELQGAIEKILRSYSISSFRTIGEIRVATADLISLESTFIAWKDYAGEDPDHLADA